MTKRERRTFTPEFKKQMVQLHQNKKLKKAFIEEYELTPASLDWWIHQDEKSSFFKEKDSRSFEQIVEAFETAQGARLYFEGIEIVRNWKVKLSQRIFNSDK